MSLLIEIAVAFAVAVLIGVIFFYLFKIKGPWATIWSVIIILFLAGLAAAGWVKPFGPEVENIYWLPILLVILFFALILSAASANIRKNQMESVKGEKLSTPKGPEKNKSVTVMSMIFLLIVLFLLVAVLTGIVKNQEF